MPLDRLHDSERRAEGAAAAMELNPRSSPVLQSCDENEKQVGRLKAAAAASWCHCRVDARRREDLEITIVINCRCAFAKRKKQREKKSPTVLCRVFASLSSHLHQTQKKVSKLGKCWLKTPRSSGSGQPRFLRLLLWFLVAKDDLKKARVRFQHWNISNPAAAKHVRASCFQRAHTNKALLLVFCGENAKAGNHKP